MMKKTILTALGLLWAIFSFAQDFEYTEVVPADSSSKSQLFARAQKWAALNTKTGTSIKADDADVVTARIAFRIAYYSREPIITGDITLELKEGRYRYSISNLVYTDKTDQFPVKNFPKSWAGKKKLHSSVHSKVQSIISSLKSALAEQGDDW